MLSSVAHRSASSAEQRRAVPCPTVRCGTVWCCAVLHAVLYSLFRTSQVSFDELSSSSAEAHHTSFVSTTLLDNMKCSQLSSAELWLSSAPRSAVLPYLALRCGAVLCRAALCFLSNTPSTSYAKYRVPKTGMHVCTRLFDVFIDCPPSRSSWRLFSRKLHPYCRSEHDVANKHTAQQRAISSAPVALGIIKSLVAANHGPLLSASFTFR